MSQANRLGSKRTVPRSFFRFTHFHVRVVKAVAGSLVLHTLAVAMGGAIAIQTSEPKMDTQSLPFKWDVSLITAPAFEPVTSDVPAHTLSAPPQEQQSPPSQNFQHAAFTDSPNSLSQPTEASNLRSSPKQDAAPKPFEPLTNGQQIPSMSSGNHTAAPPTGRSASHSQRTTRERSHTIPLTQGHDATLPPPVERVIDHSEHVRQQSVVEVPKVLQRPRPYHRLVRRLDTRPDYGWLIHDLRDKLEQLKFYPQIARLNKWEGTVLIQMKILEDGYLIEPAVEESSGVEVLDQTALAIIRQASPLKLAHPLLAKTVMLSVPLTFHLE